MAKRQAKAALAPQTVQVSGVDNGTSTITVESVSDATKKDSIDVEVLEITVSTGSVNPPSRDLEVDAEYVVSSGLSPTATELKAKGATITWAIVDSVDSETPNTNASIVPIGDGDTATVKGVKEGGAVAMCKVVLDTITEKDGSGFTVIPKVDPNKPTSIYISETASGSPAITEVSVEKGKVHTLAVHVLPTTAPQGWKITDAGSPDVAAIQTDGNFLSIDAVQSGDVGTTNCTVASTTDESITATLKVTVTAPSE